MATRCAVVAARSNVLSGNWGVNERVPPCRTAAYTGQQWPHL